jgi:VWFA-related protein
VEKKVLLRVALLCSLIPAIAASAQIPSNSFQQAELLTPATTIAKSVDEVNLAFTVTDKHGHFISNLGPADFHLLDNNQRPEKLTFFQQRSDLPLHLAIVIDASSSVEYRFRFETASAAEFLKKVLRPGTDEAFVVTFNDTVRTVVGPTDKAAKLTAALQHLKPGGNTDLHGAVVYASEKLRDLPESQITRRAIVLISDGVDTVHHSTLEQAQQAASRSQVMLFALTTNESDLDPNASGDKILQQLAASTGGAMLAAHDEGRLTSAFNSVQKALRNQYVLAYTPAAFMADGSFRRVELRALKRGLRTNCRRGYYAKSHPQR